MKLNTAQTIACVIGLLVLFPTRSFAAELKLEAEKATLAVGETMNVNVNVSGKEPTVGIDLVLSYDPKVFQVLGVEDNAMYPVYNPSKTSRVNASTGTIKLSGSANFGKPINAEGTFAMIKLKALVPGQATFSISYKKGNTTLTGVLGKNGEELLSTAPKALTIAVTGDVKKSATSVSTNSNPVIELIQTITQSVSTFFQSLFSWVK